MNEDELDDEVRFQRFLQSDWAKRLTQPIPDDLKPLLTALRHALNEGNLMAIATVQFNYDYEVDLDVAQKAVKDVNKKLQQHSREVLLPRYKVVGECLIAHKMVPPEAIENMAESMAKYQHFPRTSDEIEFHRELCLAVIVQEWMPKHQVNIL